MPVGLVADEVTASSVSLSWDASTDNVAVDEYVVSRDGVAVGSTPSTSFVNGGLVASTAYTYTVEAFDAAGNGSGESDPLTVTTTEPPPGPVTLVGAGSVWRYLDDGSSPAGWNQSGFDDSGWTSGAAQLGYGDGDEATVVDRNGLTTYFRHTFNAANTAQSLDLSVLRDDGVVVYLNGTEIWRNNMPTGTITNTTRASGHVSGTGERQWIDVTVPGAGLSVGTNVIAVEIHQSSPNSSDISFDLELVG